MKYRLPDIEIDLDLDVPLERSLLEWISRVPDESPRAPDESSRAPDESNKTLPARIKSALVCGYFLLEHLRDLPVSLDSTSDSTRDSTRDSTSRDSTRDSGHLNAELARLRRSEASLLDVVEHLEEQRASAIARARAAAMEAERVQDEFEKSRIHEIRERVQEELSAKHDGEMRIRVLEARTAVLLEAAKEQRQLAEQLAAVKVQRDHFRGICESRESSEAAVAMSRLHTRIAELESGIAKLESENSVLKRSNAGKGSMGEFEIAKMIRSAFPRYEVLDASQQEASCDLHVFLEAANPTFKATPQFVAIESKNKAAVTSRGDIDKFLRDCASLTRLHGPAFLGAVFVSLRSANIPGRGSFAVEMTPEMRVVVFVGFGCSFDCSFGDSGDAGADMTRTRMLEHCVRIVVEVGRACLNLATSDSEVKDIRARLSPLVERVQGLLREVATIRDAAGRILKSCQGTQEAISVVLQEISGICGVSGVCGVSRVNNSRIPGIPAANPIAAPVESTKTPVESAVPNANSTVTCEKCGKTLNVRGFPRHRASCSSG